jgi:phenylpropionate dioxygenase-like ring-hydroxylating dioxygenase large terminal subunit
LVVKFAFLPASLLELSPFCSLPAGEDFDVDRVTWLWHHTTQEDEYIIMRNSEGVNSRFFEPGPYHPEFEFTLQEFIRWYLATLERTLPELAHA